MQSLVDVPGRPAFLLSVGRGELNLWERRGTGKYYREEREGELQSEYTVWKKNKNIFKKKKNVINVQSHHVYFYNTEVHKVPVILKVIWLCNGNAKR